MVSATTSDTRSPAPGHNRYERPIPQTFERSGINAFDQVAQAVKGQTAAIIGLGLILNHGGFGILDFRPIVQTSFTVMSVTSSATARSSFRAADSRAFTLRTAIDLASVIGSTSQHIVAPLRQDAFGGQGSVRPVPDSRRGL